MVLVEKFDGVQQGGRARLKEIRPQIKEDVQKLEGALRQVRVGATQIVADNGAMWTNEFDREVQKRARVNSVMTFYVNLSLGLNAPERSRGLMVEYYLTGKQKEYEGWGVILEASNEQPLFIPANYQFDDPIGSKDHQKTMPRQGTIKLPIVDSDSREAVLDWMEVGLFRPTDGEQNIWLNLANLVGVGSHKGVHANVQFHEVLRGRANLPFNDSVNRILQQPKLENLETLERFSAHIRTGMTEFNAQTEVVMKILGNVGAIK